MWRGITKERKGRGKGREEGGRHNEGEERDIVRMWWHGYERKEMERCCQLKEVLSAASDRSLRRTGTQTGLLLATAEALAPASLAARETYMWVYVWVCVFVGLLPGC